MSKYLLYSSVLAFLWAFVVSIFATPSIIHLAHKKRLLDEPNNRTVHVDLTPRLGGIAIFAGFMSALTIFATFSTPYNDMQFILGGCILIFFIGLKDDIEPVSAFKKFFIQVCVAGIVMVLGDIRITNLHGLLGFHEIEIGVSYSITFFVIVGLTNAVNLIDGLDGLAGVVIVIIAGSFGGLFLSVNSVYSLLGFCLMGSVLGFLRYNIVHAKIFMGDTGSLVSGFLISMMAIKFFSIDSVEISPIIAAGVLIIPLFDTFRVFVLRVLDGKSPFAPDKNHVHHVLMRKGLKPVQVVLLLAVVNLVTIFGVKMLIGFSINIVALLLVGYILTLFAVVELLNKGTR